MNLTIGTTVKLVKRTSKIIIEIKESCYSTLASNVLKDKYYRHRFSLSQLRKYLYSQKTKRKYHIPATS